MAVTIPTLNELYTDILSDLQTKLGVTISPFGKSFLRALAGVQAAKLKLYYLAIASVQKNIFADTAESELNGGTLERFGRIKLGRNPFAATAAVYTVEVTGTIGATIQASTTFKSGDNSLNPSKIFQLDAAYTLVSSPDTITLRALEGGLDSKLSIGDTLTATAPIANVDSIAEVTVETTTPLAAETIEDYRTKVVEAYQLEPQGGAGSDYRLWSADAQGVKKVYPYNKKGFPNEIEIYVEATVVDSIDGKGTPSTAILDDVESVIEFDPDTTKPLNERGRRPLGIFNIDINPITAKNITIQITGFNALTVGKQATILTALTEYIGLIRPFVDSVDILSDKNDTLSVNGIIFAIQNALPSASFTSVTLNVDAVLVNSYKFTYGEIPYLESINYV